MNRASQATTLAVVVVTFNRAEQLKRCLQSIFESSLQPDEVVVFDNASIDQTRDIVHLFPARYIRSHENLGCPAARNIAIANTNCELVYFLDDDGWLDFYALARIVNAFFRLTHTGRKIGALTSYVELTSNSNISGKSVGKRISSLTQLKNFSGGASLILKKAFFESGCYPQDFWGYGEEFDLSIRLLDRGYQIFQVPESVMFHEAIQQMGRINRKFIFFNLRNVIRTVAENFPLLLVIPGILWYAARWSYVAAKFRVPHYALMGIFAGLISIPHRLIARKQSISYSTIRRYIAIH